MKGYLAAFVYLLPYLLSGAGLGLGLGWWLMKPVREAAAHLERDTELNLQFLETLRKYCR